MGISIAMRVLRNPARGELFPLAGGGGFLSAFTNERVTYWIFSREQDCFVRVMRGAFSQGGQVCSGVIAS